MSMQNTPSLIQLLAQLEQQHLLQATAKANIQQALQPSAEPSTPLLAQILAGIGAWLAAWFLLLFLAMGLSFDPESAAWLWIGVVLFGVGLWLQHQIANDTVFMHQFSFALLITGQLLALFGIFQIAEPQSENYFFILLLAQLLLSSISYVFSKQFSVRWLAVMAVCIWAWLALPFVLYLGILVALCCGLWRPAQAPYRYWVVLQPLAWAILWALPCGLLANELQVLWFLHSTATVQPLLFWFFSPAQGVIALGLLVTIGQLSQCWRGWSMLERLLTGLLFILLSLCSPASVMLAVWLLVIGFASDRRGIQACAVLFLSYALWLLYYTLALNLAEKSLLMVGTGGLLLGLGWGARMIERSRSTDRQEVL